MLSLWLMQDRPYGDEQRLAETVVRRLERPRGADPIRLHVLAWRQAWPTIREALFDETLPDILEVGSTWRACLTELGALIPVPESMSPSGPDPKARGFTPTLTVPWTRDARLLYFRRSTLKRLGLRPADLATWDGFEDACEQVRRRSSCEALGLPGQAEPTLVHTAIMWVWAHGGDVMGTHHRLGFHPDEQGFQGLLDLVRWAERGWLSPRALADDTVGVCEGFRKGAYGFAVASTVGPASSLLKDPDVGVVPVPVSGTTVRTTYAGGTCLAVSRFTKDPSEAWRLVASMLALLRQDHEPYQDRTESLVQTAQAEIAESHASSPDERLRCIADLPYWPAVETRLAQSLNVWLARAATNPRDPALRHDMEAQTRDAERAIGP